MYAVSRRVCQLAVGYSLVIELPQSIAIGLEPVLGFLTFTRLISRLARTLAHGIHATIEEARLANCRCLTHHSIGMCPLLVVSFLHNILMVILRALCYRMIALWEHFAKIIGEQVLVIHIYLY